MQPPAAAAKADRRPSARYQPLVVVLVAVSGGIVLDRYLPLPAPAWWLAAVTGWLAWLGSWHRGCNRTAAVGLMFCLLAGGGAWHHIRWYLFDRDDLGLYAHVEPGPACVEAVAATAPRRIPAPAFDPLCALPRGDRSRLDVQITRLRDGAGWRRASGRAVLWIEGHLLGVHAGDRLRVFCQLSAPAAPQNPGEFDFAAHARADRQRSRLSADYPACVQVIGRAGRWTAGRALDELRSRGDALLWRRLEHQRSGLAAALLLGTREQLDDDTTTAFYKTGTVHLLSISGLHVGILAAFLFWTMRLGLVRRPAALVAVAAVTVFYALVIHAEPPAVRATVLVLLVCASLYWGRRLLPFNGLAAAALVVLAFNPADLFRVGPQLSFLAVATLAWFGPRFGHRPVQDPLQRLIAQTRSWFVRASRWVGRWTWRATWLTVCIWAVSTPLVMAQFHLVSPVAIVLTPVLMLPVAVGLISGFGVLVLGWLVPPLGVASGWLCDQCLWFVDACVAATSRWPGSHFWVPGPAGWWLWSFYALLAVWAAFPQLRPAPRWCLALLAVWSAIGLSAPLLRGRDRTQLASSFLSVGHGCCVVLELPDGRTLLYDAGRLGSPAAGARSISSYLWSRGLTHIDAVVISHSDVDHYNALPELLERFSVGVVYVSPVMLQDEGAAMRKLLSAVERAGVPLGEISAGDRLRVGGGSVIEVLHPTRRGVLGSDNANSLVLAVEHQRRRILLTGDLESPGMEDVLSESPYDSDVILAPHHGSHRSNPLGFAAWSTPEWVIISGGHGHDRRAVEEAYRAAGAAVLNTADTGAVTVTIDREGLAVDCWRGAGNTHQATDHSRL